MTIANLSTSDLLIIWCPYLDRVTLSDNIGKMKVNLEASHATYGPGNYAKQKPFDDYRERFYADVEWALDISEARFKEFDIRGVPGLLIRRDAESQVLITRERALQVVTPGWEKQLDPANKLWPFLVRLSYVELTCSRRWSVPLLICRESSKRLRLWERRGRPVLLFIAAIPPSVDPELMIRMLIIGYCMGIRSDRRLFEEVHVNLAYCWFCRLGLEGDVPDHSTFSKNRHGRFRDSDLLRQLFETTVARCIAEGLVGGEGFAVDGSLVRADVNRQHAVDKADGLPDPATSHAVREYLAVLDDAAFGGATPVPPKQLAVADPAARWTAASRERAFFAYATNYLIDLQHAVIVDVEATTAIRQAEATAQRRMIDRTQERFGLWPERLVGDAGYGDAKNLSWLVEERGIEPHIPVVDHSVRRDDSFERSAFTFDHDSYICPEGKRLRQSQRVYSNARQSVDQDGMLRYRASKLDCDACALKPRCCPTQPARKILRSVHEGARDLARDIATTDAYLVSRRQRTRVEMLLAHLKRILRMDRLRLRGPNGARDEFLLAATAQNLRKMPKLIPMPATPAPA